MCVSQPVGKTGLPSSGGFSLAVEGMLRDGPPVSSVGLCQTSQSQGRPDTRVCSDYSVLAGLPLQVLPYA